MCVRVEVQFKWAGGANKHQLKREFGDKFDSTRMKLQGEKNCFQKTKPQQKNPAAWL